MTVCNLNSVCNNLGISFNVAILMFFSLTCLVGVKGGYTKIWILYDYYSTFVVNVERGECRLVRIHISHIS